MSYVEIEPTYRLRRTGGWLEVEVTNATWDGTPESVSAGLRLTPWGAHRLGRREVARINAERSEPKALALRRFWPTLGQFERRWGSLGARYDKAEAAGDVDRMDQLQKEAAALRLELESFLAEVGRSQP